MTFALIAYNQEHFIEEAINGALSQTYQPLQVVLSDDRSSDRTFELMERAAQEYSGPHDVVINRNDVNRGIGAHINRVMELARGEFVVIAAGDDVSLPHRVERIQRARAESGDSIHSVYSAARKIDATGGYLGKQKGRFFTGEDSGSKTEFLESIVSKQKHVFGATNAWSRSCFEQFGPFGEDVTCEDRIIPFRSAVLGEIKYLDEELVCWRCHDENLSAPEAIAGKGRVYGRKVCKWNVEAVNHYRNDLERYLQSRPQGAPFDSARVMSKIQEKLPEVEMRLDLVDHPYSIRGCIKAFKRGVSISRIVKDYLVVNFSSAYRFFRHMSASIGRGR